MSFQVNVPPSVLARLAKTEEEISSEGGEEETTKKREDWKKLKELEEARKAGTAPAMQDEEGKDINPHIPQYIMQAPWYFGAMEPTLRHQRPQEENKRSTARFDEWYKKGVKEGAASTKFRKGACENCGAVTHVKKDCLERPRKVGARFTGEEIAPDEHIQPQLDFDFVGKRDRWNGYNPEEHKRVIEEYNKMEEAKRELRAQRIETLDDDVPEDSQAKRVIDSDAEEDEDKYADDVDMPGQKFESKQRITVRNLRIREDTAKYLFNLNINSAYYDPKTRSMRQNPFANTSTDPGETSYGGDNFVRWSGDSLNMAKRQVFAWEAYEKGTDVHLQADPTKLEMLAKEYKRKKEVYKVNAKDSILEKYGGMEHLEAPPKQMLLAQSEDYVEYSRHGTIIKGAEKAKIKSRYEEDVYINNHTSVWGSYWTEGRWGFKCCHSLIKESYCTGKAGQEAAKMSMTLSTAPNQTKTEATTTSSSSSTAVAVRSSSTAAAVRSSSTAVVVRDPPSDVKHETTGRFRFFAHAPAEEKQASSEEEKKEKKEKSKKKKKKEKKKKMKHRKKKKTRRRSSSSSNSSESEDEDEDAARELRIKEAMKREDIRVKQVNKLLTMDERKRPYNSMYDVTEPTEDDIEAFRRKQFRYDDPMASFKDNKF